MDSSFIEVKIRFRSNFTRDAWYVVKVKNYIYIHIYIYMYRSFGWRRNALPRTEIPWRNIDSSAGKPWTMQEYAFDSFVCTFTLQSHEPAKLIFLISNLLILACIPCRLAGNRHAEDAILVVAVPGSWFLLMFFAGWVTHCILNC